MGRFGSEIRGGDSQLGKYPDQIHNTVYDGTGGRFSWNADRNGDLVGQPHFTDDACDYGDPGRHPFGR